MSTQVETATVPELTSLISDLKQKVVELKNQLKPIIEKFDEGQIKTNKGVSFLEVKYQLMLQYITQLAFYVHLKLSGRSIKNHPVIESLIELRVILDRMKPIETKLKYQIDKLVRTAVLGSQPQKQDDNDPLAFKPNPMNLVSKDEDEEQEDESEKESEDESRAVYRPPKLAPMAFDEGSTKKSRQEREEERRREKASRSRVIRDLMVDMNDTPEEVDVHGGVTESFVFGDRLDHQIAEKRRYEEDNYVRLITTRKEKKRMNAKKNRMNFENEFDRERERVASLITRTPTHNPLV
ncbi:Sas10/Utp3/C1D family-domain-containing protein [Dichotomocladium elegans]|nr:Sas10/Utp3/C1D family-domain-containing protein [Dichotomocladium elegans]